MVPAIDDIIDKLTEQRNRLEVERSILERGDPKGRILSVAITELETSILWCHEYREQSTELAGHLT